MRRLKIPNGALVPRGQRLSRTKEAQAIGRICTTAMIWLSDETASRTTAMLPGESVAGPSVTTIFVRLIKRRRAYEGIPRRKENCWLALA